MPPLNAIAWARREQESTLREAIDYARITLVGITSDRRGDGADLARAFDVEHVPDLRAAVQEPGTSMLLLAAPALLDADARRLIRESPLEAFSLEPRPGEINALLTDAEEAETARFVPLLRLSDGFREARQLLGELDAPHALYLSFRSRPEEGSLFARLLDVMDLVNHLCGDVDSISATLADPAREATASSRAVPEMLTGLNGHMSVNFHFTENRCASAIVSNVADTWFRGVTMLSGTGCLRLTDRECLWSGAPGETATRTAAEPVSAGRLIGEAIRRSIEDRDRDAPPPQMLRLLALCEAARLSCRTGQAESPQRMLAMMSHV